MPFKYPSHRLQEIVNAGKGVQTGQKVQFENEGSKGKKLALELELLDGPLVNLRLLISCYDYADSESYKASLLLEGERIRSVHYSQIRRRRRYKQYIPLGWHENVIDPNLPTSDDNRNRHVAVKDFVPRDLEHFLGLVAKKWHIKIELEPEQKLPL